MFAARWLDFAFPAHPSPLSRCQACTVSYPRNARETHAHCSRAPPCRFPTAPYPIPAQCTPDQLVADALRSCSAKPCLLLSPPRRSGAGSTHDDRDDCAALVRLFCVNCGEVPDNLFNPISELGKLAISPPLSRSEQYIYPRYRVCKTESKRRGGRHDSTIFRVSAAGPVKVRQLFAHFSCPDVAPVRVRACARVCVRMSVG